MHRAAETLKWEYGYISLSHVEDQPTPWILTRSTSTFFPFINLLCFSNKNVGERSTKTRRMARSISYGLTNALVLVLQYLSWAAWHRDYQAFLSNVPWWWGRGYDESNMRFRLFRLPKLHSCIVLCFLVSRLYSLWNEQLVPAFFLKALTISLSP